MASLNQLTNGTKTTKPYLDIVCHSVNAQVLDVDTLVVGDLEAKTITLDEVASVPNPPINKVTLFGDLGGILNVTDSVGGTKTYLPSDGSVAMTGDLDLGGNSVKNVNLLNTIPVSQYVTNQAAVSVNGHLASFFGTTGEQIRDSGIPASSVFLANGTVPMTGNLDMNSHEVKNVTAVRPDGSDIIFGLGATATGASVAVGDGANGGFNNGVAVGAGASVNAIGVAIGQGTTCTGNNDVAIGATAQSHNQFDIAIGDGAVASGGIAIGQSSNAANGFAIAIGDTAVNAVPNSCLLGDAAIIHVRPNSAICDLGTTAQPFKACWLIDNQVAVGSKFSMYGDVPVNNTAVETPITTGTAAGDLAYSAGIPLGTVFEFDNNFLVNSAAGDTLTVRYYTNAGLLLSHIITYPAVTVNSPANIRTMMTVRNGAIQIYSVECVSGVVNIINTLSVVFDRTIANTFSVTAQWGLAASQANFNQFFVKTNYRS